MSNMNSELALQNLKFINECNNLTNNDYVLKNNRIFKNTEGNFDQVYSLKEMEYMMYFTFNECFYLIDNYEEGRRTLIKDLYEAYDIFEGYYNTIEDKDELFEEMMDRFEEKLEYYYSLYIMGICNYYSELLGNKIYNILHDCATEVFYKKRVYLESSDNSESDNSDSDNDPDNGPDNDPDNYPDNDPDNDENKDKCD